MVVVAGLVVSVVFKVACEEASEPFEATITHHRMPPNIVEGIEGPCGK
jgi:hypothetical protein